MTDLADEIPIHLIGRLSPSCHGNDDEDDPLRDTIGPSSSPSLAPNKDKYYDRSDQDEAEDEGKSGEDSVPEVKVKVELEIPESELVSSGSDDEENNVINVQANGFRENNLRRSSRRIPPPKQKKVTSNEEEYIPPTKKVHKKREPKDDEAVPKKNESPNPHSPPKKRQKRRKVSVATRARHKKIRSKLRRQSAKASQTPEEYHEAYLDLEEIKVPSPPPPESEQVETTHDNDDGEKVIKRRRRKYRKRGPMTEEEKKEAREREREQNRARWLSLTEEQKQERRKKTNLKRQEKLKKMTEEELREYRQKMTLRRLERCARLGHEEVKRQAREAANKRYAEMTLVQKQEHLKKFSELQKKRRTEKLNEILEETTANDLNANQHLRARVRWRQKDVQRRIQNGEEIPEYLQAIYLQMVENGTEVTAYNNDEPKPYQISKKKEEEIQRRIENGEEIPEELQAIYLRMVEKGKRGTKSNPGYLSYLMKRPTLQDKAKYQEMVEKGATTEELHQHLFKLKYGTEEQRMKILMYSRAEAQRRKLRKELEASGTAPDVIAQKLKEFVYVPRRRCRAYKPRKSVEAMKTKEDYNELARKREEKKRLKQAGCIRKRKGTAFSSSTNAIIESTPFHKETLSSAASTAAATVDIEKNNFPAAAKDPNPPVLVTVPPTQESHQQHTSQTDRADDDGDGRYSRSPPGSPFPSDEDCGGNDDNYDSYYEDLPATSPKSPVLQNPPPKPPQEEKESNSDSEISLAIPSTSFASIPNLVPFYYCGTNPSAASAGETTLPSRNRKAGGSRTCAVTTEINTAEAPPMIPSAPIMHEMITSRTRTGLNISNINAKTEVARNDIILSLPLPVPITQPEDETENNSPREDYDNADDDLEEEGPSPPQLDQQQPHYNSYTERQPNKVKSEDVIQPSLSPADAQAAQHHSYSHRGSSNKETKVRRRGFGGGWRTTTEIRKTGVPRGPQSHRKDTSDLVICEDCGFSYASKCIARHKEIYHNPLWKDSICQVCGLEFTVGEAWLKHYYHTHVREKGVGSADESGSRRKNRLTIADLHKAGLLKGERLEKYLKSGAKKTRTCAKCSITVSNSSFLKQHYVTDHNPNFRNLRCLLCPDDGSLEKFTRKKDFYRHYIEVHPKEAAVFTATVAPPKAKRTNRIRKENAAETRCDNSDFEEKICSECGETLAHLKSLQVHMYYQHGEGSLPENFHQCHACPKKFKFIRALNYHIKVHHPNDALPSRSADKSLRNANGCELCSKTVHRTELASHVIAEHPESFFKCTFCGKLRFSELAQVYHEQQNCGEKDLEKAKELREEYEAKGGILPWRLRVKCEFCGVGQAIVGLRKHYLKVHKLEEDKKIKCEVCPATDLKDRLHYVLHMESIHKWKVEDALEKCSYALIEKTEGMEVYNREGMCKNGRKRKEMVRRQSGGPELEQDGKKLTEKVKRPRGRPKLEQDGRKLAEKVKRRKGRPKPERNTNNRKMQIEVDEVDDAEVSSSSSGTDSEEEEEHSTTPPSPPKGSLQNERPTRNSAKKAKGRIKKFNRKLLNGDNDNEEEEDDDSSSNPSSDSEPDDESFNVKMEPASPPPTLPPPPTPILKECSVLLKRLNPLLYNNNNNNPQKMVV